MNIHTTTEGQCRTVADLIIWLASNNAEDGDPVVIAESEFSEARPGFRVNGVWIDGRAHVFLMPA